MSDIDELRDDVAEAVGKMNALICAHGALIATLAAKDIFTADEIATLAAESMARLIAMPGMPEDVQELAMSALRGFAGSWSALVTRH